MKTKIKTCFQITNPKIKPKILHYIHNYIIFHYIHNINF